MTLPALVRTWQFQVNNAILTTPTGSATTCCQALLFAIKGAMKGNGSWTDAAGLATASAGNWTVRSSSDGVGGFGNNDGIDRWAASTNIIGAAPATNHSWIVLEQSAIPGAVGNLQVCIDCNSATPSNANVLTSVSAGFAAGTATARPTAADEQSLNTAVGGNAVSTRWGGPNANANTVLHALKTTTGTAIRVIMMRVSNGGAGPHTVGYWAFELPLATTAWTAPSACVAQGNDTATPGNSIDIPSCFNATQVTWSRIPGGANFASAWTSLGMLTRGTFLTAWGGNASQVVLNAIGGTEPMIGVGLYASTLNSRGRNGRFVDLYQGVFMVDTAQFGNHGRTSPASGTLRQWVKFGQYFHPWNLSIPLVVA